MKAECLKTSGLEMEVMTHEILVVEECDLEVCIIQFYSLYA